MIHPFVNQNHWQEWIDSAVNPAITSLNVRSLSGDQPYDYLLYSDKIKRRNDGRVTPWTLRTYAHVEDGGWWVDGVDPLNNWEPMLWGQFKPNNPRTDGERNRQIKYEQPPQTATRIILMRVPLHVWQLVSERSGVPMPADVAIENGEAIGFWDWVVANNVPCTLTEGAKKSGALLTAGYAAIALPGIFNGYRKVESDLSTIKSLIPDLKVFATEKRRISVCFDFESRPSQIRNLQAAIAQTGKLFHDARCKVSVVSLPGREKGVDDFIAARGIDAYVDLDMRSVSLGYWQSKRYRQLSYAVASTVNQRYLDIKTPDTGLVCIKSAKGTGKTHRLIEVVRNAIGQGQRVLNGTHRIQLGRAICNDIGIEWIDDNGLKSEDKSLFGFGLCINSFWKLPVEEFDGCVLILDEVEQFLWDALNSSTCVEKRVEILEKFEDILRRADLVIAQDADLSDLSISYLEAKTGHKPWVCVNEWKPTEIATHRMYRSSDASALWADTEEMIEKGNKLFIVCDSQQAKSKWGSTVMEAKLKKRFPGLRVLRIDSQSVADPHHPAFGCVDHINEVVRDYDVVIGTPTIGTGVSVNIRGNFDAVIGFFQGVISANDARQMLGRVREFIPRFVWAKQLGLNSVGNGSIFASAIQASKQRETALNVSRLNQVDFDLEAVSEGQQSRYDGLCLKTWASMAARINCDRVEYFESIASGLREEGHVVEILEVEKDDQASNEMSEVKEEVYSGSIDTVIAAEDMTEGDYKIAKKKHSHTKDEAAAIRKYELKSRYGESIPVDSELIRNDDDGWYSKIRLHYFLTHDRAFVDMRDKKHLAGHLERGKGKLFLQDVRLLSAQVDFLKKIGILELIAEGRELRGCDEDVHQIAQTLATHAKDVKSLMGLSISADRANQKPIRVIGDILGKLGIQLECVRSEKKRAIGDNTGYIDLIHKSSVVPKKEIKVRVYRATVPCDRRDVVFEGWKQKHSEDLASFETPEVLSWKAAAKSIAATPSKHLSVAPMTTKTQSPSEAQNLSPSDIELIELYTVFLNGVDCSQSDEVMKIVDEMRSVTAYVRQSVWDNLKGLPVRSVIKAGLAKQAA